MDAAQKDQLIQLLLEDRKKAKKAKKNEAPSGDDLIRLIAAVAKGFLAQMQPQPMQALSPSPLGSLMMLDAAPPLGSVCSTRHARHQLVEPSANMATSEQQPTQSSPHHEDGQVQQSE